MTVSLFCSLTLLVLLGLAEASAADPAGISHDGTSPNGVPMGQSDEHVPIEARLADETESLLNWAKFLSGYDLDVTIPEIRFETHEFFIDNACGGRDDCRVIGWYDDRNIVRIDHDLRSLESLFERSLVVHELVHYLQHVSGRYPDSDCATYVTREREAYAAQQQFFVAYGAMPGIQAHYFSCNELDGGEIVVAHDP